MPAQCPRYERRLHVMKLLGVTQSTHASERALGGSAGGLVGGDRLVIVDDPLGDGHTLPGSP
jgi:hypothetical protein